MKAVVDRLEGSRAVLIVDGAEMIVKRDQLPREVREGDVIDLFTRTIDAEATRKAKEELARARAEAFAGKTVKGDVEL